MEGLNQFPRHIIGTAIHEAGHSIAAWALGDRVTSVYFSQLHLRGGHMAYFPKHSERQLPYDHMVELIVLSAGPEAALLYDADSDPADSWDRANMISEARLLAGIMAPESEITGLISQAKKRAQNLLVDRWDNLLKFAEVLAGVHMAALTLIPEEDDVITDLAFLDLTRKGETNVPV